jgi:hypothetical protein
MHLTAKSLKELIDSLRSNTAEPGERRAEPRVGLRVRAEILLPGGGASKLGVWVRDVSAAGIGILCEKEFEPGDTFALVLGPDASNLAHCTVKNCRKIDGRLFGTGARFSDYRPRTNRRSR